MTPQRFTTAMDVRFRADGFTLSAAQRTAIEESLGTLRKAAACFTVADLLVHVHRHQRSGDFHVKTTLKLPGGQIFTGERGELLHHVCEQCIHKLVRKVKGYKARMSGRPQRSRVATREVTS